MTDMHPDTADLRDLRMGLADALGIIGDDDEAMVACVRERLAARDMRIVELQKRVLRAEARAESAERVADHAQEQHGRWQKRASELAIERSKAQDEAVATYEQAECRREKQDARIAALEQALRDAREKYLAAVDYRRKDAHTPIEGLLYTIDAALRGGSR